MSALAACGSGDGDSSQGPSLSGGTGGSGGASGASGSGGASGTSASGGTGGWATTECTTGEVQDCYTGPPGTSEFGTCRSGLAVCHLGVFGACDGEVHPAAEICNGLDDNCDGRVDEGCSCAAGATQDCYSGPSDTLGVGQCQGGLQECGSSGEWSASCVGEVTPGPEVCNGLDDDCNGVIDDVASPRLYRLSISSVTWTSQLLSDAWTGPHAPSPCTSIETVFHAYDFSQLMVFTTAGQLHLREHGVWQAPVPATSRFRDLPRQLDAVYQLPWAWQQHQGYSTMQTHVTFSSSPDAYIYFYEGNADTPTYAINRLTVEPVGPPRPAVRDRWSFERLSSTAPLETTSVMTSSEDGKLYQQHTDLTWARWDDPRSHPYFDAPGAPDANACVAAWFDIASQTAHLICD